MNFFTNSAHQTRMLGRVLAGELVYEKSPRDRAFVLGLEGDLGGGKTTFMQGLANGLGIQEKITSPTFVIMKKFQISKSPPALLCNALQAGKCQIKSKTKNPKKWQIFSHLYHFDCYRFNKPEDILSLGWREIIADPCNIVAIEWPERIGGLLPPDALEIKFVFKNQNQRRIIMRRAARL